MRRLIFCAMAAVVMLACSKEQVIEKNRANDEITFNVVTDNQTKAAAVYCNNNLLPEFNVCATYTKDDATQWYFQNDKIKYEKGSWNNKTTNHYWSSDGTHDFYAIYNGTMKLTGIYETPEVPAVDFAPSTDVSQQLDLLYAVSKGYTKDDKIVNLNFRHALSQIEFRAKNTHDRIYVKILGVKVGQVPGDGEFTYPSNSTDKNYENHHQATTDSEVMSGSWNVDTTAPRDYIVEFDEDAAIDIPVGNASKDLTISTDESGSSRNFTNSMLLLPTSSLEITVGGNTVRGTTAWTPAAGETTYDGSYLAVKCQIYNVAGGSYNPATDVCIYNDWAVIPVAFNWEPGKKYVYTFVFGQGNGGYEPNPNAPNPVLTPVSYDVTVDDFQRGTSISDSFDMETK